MVCLCVSNLIYLKMTKKSKYKLQLWKAVLDGEVGRFTAFRHTFKKCLGCPSTILTGKKNISFFFLNYSLHLIIKLMRHSQGDFKAVIL